MPLFPSSKPRLEHKGFLTAAGLPKDPTSKAFYQSAFHPEYTTKKVGRDALDTASSFIESNRKLKDNLEKIKTGIDDFKKSSYMKSEYEALLHDALVNVSNIEKRLKHIHKLNSKPANDRIEALANIERIKKSVDKLGLVNRNLNSTMSRVDNIKHSSLPHLLKENNIHVSSSEKSITNLGNAIVSEQDKIFGHAQKSIEKPFDTFGKAWAHMCKALASTVHPKLGDPPKF